MGELHLCVAFRKLNEITKKDAFPLPRCDDLLDAAGQGNPCFITKLDMAQGFHQVPLSKDASRKTAFVTPEGHYQYVTMPFGLTCCVSETDDQNSTWIAAAMRLLLH